MKDNGSWFPAIMIGMILLFVSFLAVDGCTGHSEGSYSIIINKEYIPARDWTTFEYDGDTEAFKTIEHHDPEHWNLCVDYKNDYIVMDVNKIYWHQVKVGDVIPVTTWVGGISKAHYGYRIQKAEN